MRVTAANDIYGVYISVRFSLSACFNASLIITESVGCFVDSYGVHFIWEFGLVAMWHF